MKFSPANSLYDWRCRRLLCAVLGHPEFEPFDAKVSRDGGRHYGPEELVRCIRCAQLRLASDQARK